MTGVPTPCGYEWRYSPGGHVRHLLVGWMPLCRRPDPLRGDWYGTGSQAEYDRCAALPACRDCIRQRPEAADWSVAT